MTENMKQSGHSFLDKFRGKTNKISKQGINHLLKQRLQPIQKQIQYKILQSSRNEAPLVKLPTRIRNDKQSQAKKLAADMDELFAPNLDYGRNKKVILKKIDSQNQSIISPQSYRSNNSQKKQRLLPPLYTPQQNIKRTSLSSKHKSFIDQRQHQKADSQLESINSQKKSKYVFGKYLKLDQQAMKHFQFLINIQKRSIFKDNKQKIISR